MNILKWLSGHNNASEQSRASFRVGDRVRDPWGNKHTIIEIIPKGENGLGTIRTRADGGGESVSAMFAHGFTLLPPEEAGFSPPDFSVQRVNPEKSSASAYSRLDTILLCGCCITNYGTVTNGPVESIEITAPNEAIGGALLRTLTEARIAPVPTEPKQDLELAQKRLFQMAGVRSASRFNAGARYCSVEQTPNEILISPTENEGRYFSSLGKSSMLRIPVDSNREEIGKALREGFSRCI